MKHTCTPLVISFSLALLLQSCGGRQDVYQSALRVSGPYPAEGCLCFLNRTLGQLVRLGIEDGTVSVERALLRPRPLLLEEVDGGRALAVLHDGSDYHGLSLLDPGSLIEKHWLQLAERFDKLAVSPSGRYVVAHFSPDAAMSGPAGIRNLNQIQVLDVVDSRAHPPLALQTGGLSPRAIDFLPSGSVDFEDIVVVTVDNGLVFLDPDEPAQQPLRVRFTNSPGGLAVPAEVVYGPFSPLGGYVYVSLQGSEDILSVFLTRQNGLLRRTVNFLNVPAGSRPTDLLVLEGDAFAEKVFVVFGGGLQKAAVLDANSIHTDEKTISFDAPVSYGRLLVAQDGSRQFVAVFEPGGTSSRIFIVDPDTGSSQVLHLQDDYELVSGPDDGSFLVAFHPDLGGTSLPGIRVVRMHANPDSGKYTPRVATYFLSGAMRSYAFTGQGMEMLAALEEQATAFLLDLDTGEYHSVLLDRQAVAAGLVPRADTAYFMHAHPLGSLTLVPLAGFDRARAVTIEGFMLHRLLDPGR